MLLDNRKTKWVKKDAHTQKKNVEFNDWSISAVSYLDFLIF